VKGSRKIATLVVATVLASAAIVLLGRWEEHRSARMEVARMRIVLDAVGPLQSAQATGYRISDPSCLAYSVPQNRFGLQLCFDASGRLVETVDRRGSQPVYASLNYDPDLSTIHFAPSFIQRLLARATS
jgi:hypothetical protein